MIYKTIEEAKTNWKEIEMSKRCTSVEIGKKYNITRERVRQIEAKALKKIRSSKQVKELAVYMQKPDESLENIEEFRKKYRENSKELKSYLRDYRKTKENDLIDTN